ncbi:hypothetical protein DSO57_1030295 [Entomophthora muscae]|uniref:Uncharacterized protein n=1 Tax=Entomophthora muscae TaxID=34485 RepID=A0ACC2SPW1_9FUNG|nr:hypothetical protein DSO57_1030295 [Entomophthora muscae]
MYGSWKTVEVVVSISAFEEFKVPDTTTLILTTKAAACLIISMASSSAKNEPNMT